MSTQTLCVGHQGQDLQIQLLPQRTLPCMGSHKKADMGSLVPAGGKLGQHSVNPALRAHCILLPHDDSPSFLFSLHLLEHSAQTACSLQHPEGSPIATWAAFGI